MDGGMGGGVGQVTYQTSKHTPWTQQGTPYTTKCVCVVKLVQQDNIRPPGAPTPLTPTRPQHVSASPVISIPPSFLPQPPFRPANLRHHVGRLRCLVGENREGVPRRQWTLAAAAQQHRRQYVLVARQCRASADRGKYGRRYQQRLLKGLLPLGTSCNTVGRGRHACGATLLEAGWREHSGVSNQL